MLIHRGEISRKQNKQSFIKPHNLGLSFPQRADNGLLSLIDLQGQKKTYIGDGIPANDV